MEQDNFSANISEGILVDSIKELVDKSIQQALGSAMSCINDNINKSVALAISKNKQAPERTQPSTPSDKFWSADDSTTKRPGKSTRKRNNTDYDDSLTKNMARESTHNRDNRPSYSGAPKRSRPSGPEEESDKRAQSSSRRNKPDSFVDYTSDDLSNVSFPSDTGDTYDSGSDNFDGVDKETPDTDNTNRVILDTQGIPFFTPDQIKHPRSGDWAPLPQIAQYVASLINRPLDRPDRKQT